MKKILTIILVIAIGVAVFSGKQKTDQVVHIDDVTDFYEIKADYVVDRNDKEEVVKSFIENIVNQKKEEWKVGGEIYNIEMQIAKDFPDRPKMQYQLYIAFSTSTSQKLNTNTYVYSIYEYTGGAHGNTNLATFTFDKDGLKNIEDYLIFDDNKDIEIVRLLGKKLEKVLGSMSSKETIDFGLGLAFLDIDNTLNKAKCNCDGYFFPSNLQNFVVLDDGIKFIMGQYHVAPYAAGMPEVIITWEELKPYLKVNI